MATGCYYGSMKIQRTHAVWAASVSLYRAAAAIIHGTRAANNGTKSRVKAERVLCRHITGARGTDPALVPPRPVPPFIELVGPRRRGIATRDHRQGRSTRAKTSPPTRAPTPRLDGIKEILANISRRLTDRWERGEVVNRRS